MLKTEFTSGPWKLFDGHDKARPIIVDSIPDVNGKCVANCVCYLATTNDCVQANAQLIIAAPELLEACLSAIRLMEHPDEFLDCQPAYGMLRDAVQKATRCIL
jgi:hypothetical protein